MQPYITILFNGYYSENISPSFLLLSTTVVFKHYLSVIEAIQCRNKHVSHQCLMLCGTFEDVLHD